MHSTYRINAQDFYDFDKCPHRVYLNRFGDPKEKLPHSDFLNMLFENALTHEHEVISDGMECLRVKTETTYLKRRAIKALRSVTDFLESKLDAAEVSPCDLLPSP
jgi:predicted RecB family nuclease